LATIEKISYRKNIAKELTRVNKFERTNVIVIKGEPIGCSNHTTFAYEGTKFGRHKEKGPQVRNRKLQLLE
jgi:hypothetical protein